MLRIAPVRYLIAELIMMAGNADFYDTAHPGGMHLAITGTYWLAWGTLLGAAAVTVAAAAASLWL